MFKNKTSLISLALFSIVFLLYIAYSTDGQSTEDPKPLLITESNTEEIKEDVNLDEFGIDVLNAERKQGKVSRNESLYIILSSLGLDPLTIHEINQTAKSTFSYKDIKPGQTYYAYKDLESGTYNKLVLKTDLLNYFVFEWGDEITVRKEQKSIESELVTVTGTINSSLYESLIKQGRSTMIGLRLSEIFAWQIDFFRLYPGDSYKVIYEREFVDGKPFRVGQIHAAEFTSRNQTYDAFYYETDEKFGFYDAEGNGVQKALLKAPFKFSHRISSGFSYNRFHPVLKEGRPHYGVDYAAPLGTPVLSVGDGQIVESQYRGANGNIVKIRHNDTYTTAYLHLNGFGPGIKRGVKVKQGQVIGYVGRTGRVTGVHLHYTMYRNGQPVNPLTIELPSSEGLESQELKPFKDHIQQYIEMLDQAENEESVATLER
ncbi:peptidoglycan DD-metalloendopeptidase family protein [Gracilimonas sp.]|uniref:peptidoglycan DD-metalloendopeptidase family protein n=1 Tax=Gracilimonas sp. TaxID=1974203 RepID=UPI00287183F9|nr:peptidoglycan DD-metalloendopeptidase family protein [Gracilimonas sp.]